MFSSHQGSHLPCSSDLPLTPTIQVPSVSHYCQSGSRCPSFASSHSPRNQLPFPPSYLPLAPTVVSGRLQWAPVGSNRALCFQRGPSGSHPSVAEHPLAIFFSQLASHMSPTRLPPSRFHPSLMCLLQSGSIATSILLPAFHACASQRSPTCSQLGGCLQWALPSSCNLPCA